LGDLKPLKKKKLNLKLKKLPVKTEDIKKILNIPFTQKDYNESTIKSLLLDKYTADYDENLKLLRKELEQGKEYNYIEYYTYLDNIRTHLDKYHYLDELMFNYEASYELKNEERKDVKNEDNATYIETLKSLLSTYDPLNITSEQVQILKDYLICHKGITLYNNMITYEFKEAITHKSNDRVTKKTLKNKLNANIKHYYAIQFISKIINNWYISTMKGNVIINIDLINMLVDDHNNILVNNRQNDDVSKESDIQNSSSLNPDTVVKSNRKEKKEKYIWYLNNNVGYANKINEEDMITKEKWNDMSLSELRKVIKISYEIDGKIYCWAHDATALYRSWKKIYKKFKTDKNFNNPHSNLEFSPEDKMKILITLGKRDFRYDKDFKFDRSPKYRYWFDSSDILRSEQVDTSAESNNPTNKRYDTDLIISEIEIDGIIYWEVKIIFYINKGIIIYKSVPGSFKLVRINIKADIIIDIEKLFNQLYLLHESDKILGKMIPFKIHPAFDTYNFKNIDEEEDYKIFYDMLFTIK